MTLVVGTREITFDDAVLLGRDPSGHDATPVVLDDPVRSASKNHALLRACGGLVEVTDLGSTNGTVVVVGSGSVDIEPHQPTHVQPPCRVICGDVAAEVRL